MGNLKWSDRKVSLTDVNPLINSLEIIVEILEINLVFYTVLFSFPDNLFYN